MLKLKNISHPIIIQKKPKKKDKFLNYYYNFTSFALN